MGSRRTGTHLAKEVPAAASLTAPSEPYRTSDANIAIPSLCAAEGRIRSCIADDVKCYALQNPDLLHGYCGGDYANCDWSGGHPNKFLAHWSGSGFKEGRKWGCETPAARCYILNNPDVMQYVCSGSIDRCNWLDVHKHYLEAGRAEGRAFECTPASPPAPIRSPPPPRPPPFVWKSTQAAKSGGPTLGDTSTCRATDVRIVWLAATEVEASALVSRMGLFACGGPLPMFQKGEQMLVVSGRGRAKAAAAVAWASARNDDVGGLAWLNVGLAGHRSLAYGEVRGLSSLYDVSTGGQYFPGDEALAGMATMMGATVDRPATTYTLDALYDMEASPFFEIASMLSEPQLIASVKVVSDHGGNREPDEATAERYLGAAWPQLKQVANKLVAMARIRRRRTLEVLGSLGSGNSSHANYSKPTEEAPRRA